MEDGGEEGEGGRGDTATQRKRELGERGEKQQMEVSPFGFYQSPSNWTGLFMSWGSRQGQSLDGGGQKETEWETGGGVERVRGG